MKYLFESQLAAAIVKTAATAEPQLPQRHSSTTWRHQYLENRLLFWLAFFAIRFRIASCTKMSFGSKICSSWTLPASRLHLWYPRWLAAFCRSVGKSHFDLDWPKFSRNESRMESGYYQYYFDTDNLFSFQDYSKRYQIPLTASRQTFSRCHFRCLYFGFSVHFYSSGQHISFFSKVFLSMLWPLLLFFLFLNEIFFQNYNFSYFFGDIAFLSASA